MTNPTTNFSANADWLMSVYGRFAVDPGRLIVHFLATEPLPALEVVMARAKYLLSDMLSGALITREAIEAAAEQIAAPRPPHVQAAAVASAKQVADSHGATEQSSTMRWLNAHSINPMDVLETLVESGAITFNQVRDAAGSSHA